MQQDGTKTMKIRFETQPCGRCGGSGRYSYCTMYGDKCFGCNGNGRVLTRDGSAAQQAIADARERMCGITAETVKPGMKVLLDGKWRRITHTERELTTYQAANTEAIRLGTANMVYVKTLGTRVVQAPTAEQRKALIEKARTLKGASVVETEADHAQAPERRTEQAVA